MVNKGLTLKDYTWHCLYVPPQRELLAGHDLGASGYPVIVPAEKVWRHRGGPATYRPVMPRYVFTGFRGAPNFERLRTLVPMVQGYMEFGNGPAALRQHDVEWLYDLRESLRHRQRPVEDVIRVGDQVMVSTGPLAGKSIVVEKIVAKRVHTIMKFLGALRLFELELANVAQIR